MHFVLWIWCLFSNTYCWTFQCIRKSFPGVCTSPPIGLLGNILPQTLGQWTSQAVSWRHALLQQTFPLLFDIVSIVEGDQLPEALTAFIIDLLEKVKSPFSRNVSIPDAVQLDVHRTNDVEYYPCLPVVRSRGDYCLDDTTPNICTKRSTRHPSLLPGVFLVHCKQGTIMLWVCINICINFYDEQHYFWF